MKGIFKAIEFATKAHFGQFRKGTNIPYIVHPIGVMKILIECNMPEEVVIAGILHDVLEDTEVSPREIQVNFGETVLEIVKGVSEPDKSEPWEKRKKRTIEAIRKGTFEVLMVELADKLDNIRSIYEDSKREGESFWRRFRKPKEKQAWYYRNLLNAFLLRRDESPCPEFIDELKEKVHAVFGNEGEN